jgi:hypothetical protein
VEERDRPKTLSSSTPPTGIDRCAAYDPKRDRIYHHGNGSKDDGDREGGINLGFDWKDLVDEEGKWSITVSNDLCKDTMTVDVTPRRCQKFKLKPGAECNWSASTGAKGTVVADQWGLVTVPKVDLKAKDGTVLPIQLGRESKCLAAGGSLPPPQPPQQVRARCSLPR